MRLQKTWSVYRWDVLAVLCMAVLTILFMGRVVFQGKVLLPLDMLYTSEPWRSETSVNFNGQVWNKWVTDVIWQSLPLGTYAQQSWKSGIPLWDPLTLSGLPALARGEIFSNPFYTVLSTFLSVAKAISFSDVLTIFISQIFMYLFLRELGSKQFGALVGAVMFAFNSYLIGWLSFVFVTGALAWLPCVFWGVERAIRRKDWRWTLVGGVGFGLMILSGYLLFTFFGAITLVIYCFYRCIIDKSHQRNLADKFRPLIYCGLALGIGALLVASQLFLNLELFLQTRRTEAVGAYVSFDPYEILRLIIPNLFGIPTNGNQYWGPFVYTETDLYFGIMLFGFLLASLFSSKKKIAWIFFGIGLTLYLALFKLFPFRQITELLYPVFVNTFPGRLYSIVAFGWSVGAGLGADWLSTSRPKKMIKFIMLAYLGLMGILLSGIGLKELSKIIHASNVLFKSFTFRQINIANLYPPLLFSILAGLVFFLLTRKNFHTIIFEIMALGIVVADLFTVGINQTPAFDESYLYPVTPSINFLTSLLKNETQPVRILNINSNTILTGMSAEAYGIPTIAGYSSWVLKRYFEYTNLVQTFLDTNHIYFGNCCSSLLNALNIKYIYTAPDISLNTTGNLDLISAIGTAQTQPDISQAISMAKWNVGGIEQSVLFEHPTTEIKYNLSLTKSSSFHSSIAMDPNSWNKEGDGVLFQVLVEDNTKQTILFSRYLDPKHNLSDQKWVSVDVDLSQYVGQTIKLVLKTSPGPAGNNFYDWAGWGDPLIKNYSDPEFELLYDGPNKIYKNNEALLRTWIVHDVVGVPENDFQSVKGFLTDAAFVPASKAVIEMKGIQPGFQVIQDQAMQDESSTITTYSADKVEVDATLRSRGLLILSDNYYPGWKVFVDGKEAQIYPTNLTMRGVMLDAGKHRIQFIYAPFLLSAGFLVQAATILLIIVMLVLNKRLFSQSLT